MSEQYLGVNFSKQNIMAIISFRWTGEGLPHQEKIIWQKSLNH